MSISTLTTTERVILANQYRLLEVLDPSSAPDYRARRAVVEEGFESEYDETLRGLVIKDPVPSTVCEEVVGILGMFRALYSSYQRLSDADKRGVDADRVRFQGFDGNEETREFRYARFMIQDGRWAEFKPEDNDGYNSHYPVLPRYRRMRDAWKKLGEPQNLDREAILTIIEPG